MYQAESSSAVLKSPSLRRRGFGLPFVSRTVFLLGITSLLTDVSAEMVATVLPLYLVFALGLSPLQFGLVNGLYEGAAALLRLVGGHLGDRRGRHKEVAAAGYGLSALSKLALLGAGSATAVAGVVLVDRAGKGIRTAPRDALISLSTPREGLATAFGVHRAMDTAGAMLGPLLAFGLLALAPLDFDLVFVVSFAFALVGLAVVALLVENPPEPVDATAERAVTLRSAAQLLRGGAFAGLVAIASLLAVATVADAFVYLIAQRRADLELAFFPLLFVLAAATYMVLAVPMGRLADRIGRGRVFVAGYVVLLAVYGWLLLGIGGTAAALVPALGLGVYYAATDGVLASLASAVLPAELRGSGLALLGTATSVARLVSSIAFGATWAAFGLNVALVVFAVALAVAAAVATVMVMRGERRVRAA